MKLVTVEMKSILNPIGRYIPIDSDAFEALVIDIERHGMMNAIKVRERQDGTYEVIDGCHRLEAARRLNISRIQVEVLDDKEFEKLIKQIRPSVQKKPLGDHERARISILLLRKAAAEKMTAIREGFLHPLTLAKLADDATATECRYYGIDFKTDSTLQPWEVRIIMCPDGKKPCSACGGKGQWITEESYHGDIIPHVCPKCHGTGFEQS